MREITMRHSLLLLVLACESNEKVVPVDVVEDILTDLDGDGYVGGRDYVVARRFDKGYKNYLTKEEKAKAIEAVQNVSCNSIFHLFNIDF